MYKMICTEGYIGNGPFDGQAQTQTRSGDRPWTRPKRHITSKETRNYVRSKCVAYGTTGQSWPTVYTKSMIQAHNCIICSSVLVHRDIVQKSGKFPLHYKYEDLAYWLKCLDHTDCLFVERPCVYYDNAHGADDTTRNAQ